MGRFFRYVELRTKITSTFTFVYMLGYMVFQRIHIRWGLTLLFFVSMLLFDLTTTAINNYIDAKGNGPALPYDAKTAKRILYILLCAAIATGLWLAACTDLIVLAAGGVCFLFGICYTYGPIPISRQPLGEIMSGFFYGFMIPFIMMQINGASSPVEYTLGWDKIGLTLHVTPLVHLALLAVIPFCVTANIMLANNLCDVKKDILVKRFTLPYYIGTTEGIRLFAVLYGICFVDIFILTIGRILPWPVLAALVTAVPVWRQIRLFAGKQDKKTTFVCAIRCFIWIMGAVTACTWAGVLLQMIR